MTLVSIPITIKPHVTLMILLVEDVSGANALPYPALASPPPTLNHFLQVFMIARNKLSPVNKDVFIFLFVYLYNMKHYKPITFKKIYQNLAFLILLRNFRYESIF